MNRVREVTNKIPLTEFSITKGSGGFFIHDGDGNTWKLVGEKS